MNDSLNNNQYQTNFFLYELNKWYLKNKRDLPWRETNDPYRILVVEKLLQQTSYKHVLNVYPSFFKKYPTIYSLSQTTCQEIENVITPLGFQRQRSHQLKKIADIIMAEYSGKIPKDRIKLLNLVGIGQYITNAVLCFAYDERIPIIDVNIRRIMMRFFNWDMKDDELCKLIQKILPRQYIKDFNWSLLDFGSIMCNNRPKCRKCPLSQECYNYNFVSIIN